jgi:uridine phosphorylase
MTTIKNADFLLNNDGSIYHLCLKPGQLADTVIIVGDPERVEKISGKFSSIELKVRNREFISHTGIFNGKRLSVVSTGIGTDNIDIVVNELDALVNIDFETREIKPEKKSLNIIRIGTSGAVQPEIPVSSFAVSSIGIGFDNLLHYYAYDKSLVETEMSEAFMKHTNWNPDLSKPYFVRGSEKLIRLFEKGMFKGITVTAPGFYGPQGRILRLGLSDPFLNDKIKSFRFGEERIINFEMETSALYSLGTLLGHNVVTVCALIANRATNEYSADHNKVIGDLVDLVLNRITAS